MKRTVDLCRGWTLSNREAAPRMWCSYDRDRVWARKAQFGWRWDWGPRLVNTGLWREVELVFPDRAVVAVTIETRGTGGPLEAEVRSMVPRLCNHPSLALWCGSKEIQWIHHQKERERPEERLYGRTLEGCLPPEDRVLGSFGLRFRNKDKRPNRHF